MNIIRTFTLLASISASHGRIPERSLKTEGPAVDGVCPFGNDYTEVNFSPLNYPGDCGDFIDEFEAEDIEIHCDTLVDEDSCNADVQCGWNPNAEEGPECDSVIFQDCFPAGCEGINLKVGYVRALPSKNPSVTADFFNHLVAWDDDNEEETLYCWQFRGLTAKVDEVEDGLHVSFRGHWGFSLFGTDTGVLPTPGTYFMKGGVVDIFIDGATGVWDVEKVKGNYVDVCEEIKGLIRL